MGRIEDLITKVEVAGVHSASIIQPQVRKYYQKNGIWYAVVSVCSQGVETKMHIAVA